MVAQANRLADEFEEPGVSVIAPTQPFDAVVYPRELGMAIMVSLDRRGPVPCLTTRDHATLLVLPGTGYLLKMPGRTVEVRAGAGHWIALPPSHGVSWDTPPWDEVTGDPIPLMHGHALKPYVTSALKAAGEAPR